MFLQYERLHMRQGYRGTVYGIVNSAGQKR